MLKRHVRSLSVGALVLVAAGLLFATRNLMSAMNCETLNADSFTATLAAEYQEPVYAPPKSKSDTWTAQFLLKGFGSAANGATLILGSDLAGGMIYKGLFQPSLQIDVSRSLLARQGLDGFRVVLVNHQARRICVAEHRARFWQEGKVVTIEHLPMREPDQSGLPVAFRVDAK
jgi:hypothetical protein